MYRQDVAAALECIAEVADREVPEDRRLAVGMTRRGAGVPVGTGRVVRRGNSLAVEIRDETVVIFHPQLKAFDDMGRIYREALEFWTPGRKVNDIAEDVRRIVKAHNQVDPLDGHFIGHSLGYEMVEKPWFGIGAPDDFTLEPNMVIAPEWFIQTPFGPILFEENFLVTETGLERLTDYPSKLQVVAD